jgi:hypothetical protein
MKFFQKFEVGYIQTCTPLENNRILNPKIVIILDKSICICPFYYIQYVQKTLSILGKTFWQNFLKEIFNIFDSCQT